MLVSIQFDIASDAHPTARRQQNRHVIGTAAQVGSYIADLLLEDHPKIYGEDTKVVSMTLDIQPDPEAL